jgi:uncharacterized protein YkwD
VNVPTPSGAPADAVALALNITMTESAGPGFVTEYATGRPRPTSSVLNVDRSGQTRAAAGIFPVSSTGATLYVSGGGHVVVDVIGYFTGPSAAVSTDGLFSAFDPARMLDTRGAGPLGDGAPLPAGGGLELATGRGGSMAYNITSVDAAAGFVTAYPAGTQRPATSTVNSGGDGDVVANFAITQMSDRGLGLYGQMQTHVLVDAQGWFSGPTASSTTGPPSNATPAQQPLLAATTTYSSCDTDGLAMINSQRATPLVTNTVAEDLACAWALQLAKSATLAHSDTALRDASVGCGTGENVAVSSGTSVANLYTLWYASSGHMANIQNPIYRSVGTGFVVRTDPNGAQRIFGVNVFSVC